MTRTSLEGLRDWYEKCIFFSTLAVVIGCAMEVPEVLHEFCPKLFSKKLKRTIKVVSSVGLILVILGVAGELVFDQFRSGYDGLLQTFNDILLRDAERHTAIAIEQAGAAKASAEAAANAASEAEMASGKASRSSDAALTTAGGARREADSFEADIISAKDGATDAVSRLANAEQRLAESTQREASAEARLSAIKTPRSLVKTYELITALKLFKGTEYAFNVFQDDESIQFTKDLDTALAKAGWVRKQPGILRIGITALNVFSSERKDSVEACIATGLVITLHSENPDALVSSAPSTLPVNVQAALAFRNQLALHTFPNEEHNMVSNVMVDPTPSKDPMLICVGKKP